MKFRSRKLVQPSDLNSHLTLFGGKLLAWLDVEVYIFARCQLATPRLVTKYMSEINFMASAKQGDIIEIGCEVVNFGRTSITVRCVARRKEDLKEIITIDKVVFVNLDEEGKPAPHGVTAARED
ncbi:MULTISPECIES: acyl-CoA thioesterase [Persicobacter]|uniref:Acyl-CoA thioesterase n=1 Tax=Persicobacter diffluens TaxID=981 RepID=A0AAN4VVM7_9BACT|nr:hotdog domain-containing protein [Persicobacter sp. CCB-QB2]GJM60247.1 acyl-CoA thioesterase [Persicobacter diffluens]